jgi:DNA-directed RNA polymerase subunit RPC12/RpoP
VTEQLRLRLSLIDGPELRCPHCGEWWPITTEFWEKNEWHRCLSCKRERARLYARLRQRDAEYRTKKAEASRRYRAWLNEKYPHYVDAYERERKARNRKASRDRRAALKAKS